MRKFTLCAMMLVAAFATAAPVDQATAMQQARQFISKIHPANGRRALRSVSTALSSAQTEVNAYYVFNIGSNQGFVIVSGDDRTQPILGYTDSGTFNATRLPSNVKAWLAGYVGQLQQIDRISVTPQSGASRKAPRHAKVKYTIAPLLQTTWDQGDPYNSACPPFFDYGQSVTGCVATAMAQVMFYHQWPAATTKEIEGYKCRTTWSGLGQISVPDIPAGTAFAWDKMHHSYVVNDTDTEACRAVSALMAACGASVGMNYSTEANGGSTAELVGTARALTTYFDYSNSTRAVYRDDYTYAEWTDLLYAELEANRPVLYSGQSSGGGHAFVVDGYDGEGLFHINWGWGGYCNGYFMLSVALPSNAGGIGSSRSKDGYSYGQDAVIGIKKQDGEELNTPLMLTAEGFSVDGTTLSYDTYNMTGSTHTFDIGFAFVSADGTLTNPSWRFSNTELGPRYGFTSATMHLDVSTLGLPDGVYKMVPASKLSTDTQPQSPLHYDIDYALISVEEGEVSVILHTAQIQLVATDFALARQAHVGTDAELQVQVHNEGDEFYGLLYLCQESTKLAQIGVTIGADQTVTVPFHFKPSSAGSMQLAVALDQAGTNIIGTGTIDVSDGSSQTDLALTGISYDNEEGQTLYGRFSGTLHIHNNAESDFDGQIRINLMSNSEAYGTYDWVKNEYVTCHIPGGQDADVPFDIGQLGYNYYYAFMLYADKNRFYDLWDCKRKLMPGIITYFADGSKSVSKPTAELALPENVAAVDLTGTSTTAVTGGNPNTIYILGPDDTLPAGLTDNVVRDNEAEQLRLNSSYDFYTPIDFLAHHVSLTCLFNRPYTEQGGWQTLVVPFEVQQIDAEAGGETSTLEWRKSMEDTDADLYIMAFEHEEADVLHYTYAEAILANRPYLVSLHRRALVNTPLVFKGEEADITSQFRGSVTAQQIGLRSTLVSQEQTNVYTLDEDGAHFTLKAADTIPPFSHYIVPLGCEYTALHLNMPDIQVSIDTPHAPAAYTDVWHTLSGQRVAKPTHGIYVKGGKVVVVH